MAYCCVSGRHLHTVMWQVRGTFGLLPLVEQPMFLYEAPQTKTYPKRVRLVRVPGGPLSRPDEAEQGQGVSSDPPPEVKTTRLEMVSGRHLVQTTSIFRAEVAPAAAEEGLQRAGGLCPSVTQQLSPLETRSDEASPGRRCGFDGGQAQRGDAAAAAAAQAAVWGVPDTRFLTPRASSISCSTPRAIAWKWDPDESDRTGRHDI
ncbi:hypothetical protein D4764_0263790 [Takifugu flavidus]|uniref:Uncharacterized protein n=1 Tax=Takifugu flavidus TaxID=433684 RepID=A0A5C6MHE0_9TELE|nr:hypothetical protein D4764_0263790 [Takifugu flavidus]